MESKRVLIVLASLIVALLAGCSSVDQRINLTYDVAGGAKGGSGELFIAGPEEVYNAVKKPSGEVIIGSVQGTNRDIVAINNIEHWINLALADELRVAGYDVKPVNKLSGNAARGIKVIVSKIAANQTADLMTVTTMADMKISVEIWKKGTRVTTQGITVTNEKKGINHSEKPIEIIMKETLQNALQQLLPTIINTLEK
jgi:hypothetical protein